MLEQFFKSQIATVSDPYNAIALRMRWRLRESSSIVKRKMSIGVMRSIKQGSERWV